MARKGPGGSRWASSGDLGGRAGRVDSQQEAARGEPLGVALPSHLTSERGSSRPPFPSPGLYSGGGGALASVRPTFLLLMAVCKELLSVRVSSKLVDLRIMSSTSVALREGRDGDGRQQSRGEARHGEVFQAPSPNPGVGPRLPPGQGPQLVMPAPSPPPANSHKEGATQTESADSTQRKSCCPAPLLAPPDLAVTRKLAGPED